MVLKYTETVNLNVFCFLPLLYFYKFLIHGTTFKGFLKSGLRILCKQQSFI